MVGSIDMAARAWDHDFKPETTLKLFGISIPATNETFFYFTESNATADFMVDALEHLWPTYHSKYNPIERVWGRLKNHWNGELLNSIEKVLGLDRTMTWNGCNPVVNLITKSYEKGVRLTKSAMNEIEEAIHRIRGIEKWAVDILFYNE